MTRQVLEWNASFESGHSVLDAQHRKIFVLLGGVMESIAKSDALDVVFERFDHLVKFVAAHFQTEEMIMLAHHYEGFERHKGKHDAFLNQAKLFLAALRNREMQLDSSLGSFLQDWIHHHIFEEDMVMIAGIRSVQ